MCCSSGRPASARRRWRRSSRASWASSFRATSGPGDRARRRSRGAADQSAAARRAVHRRDPSPEPGGRGDPLSGDGGFPARPHHRRRAGGALGAHRSAALHADRRDDALGPDHQAACASASAFRCASISIRPPELERIVGRGARAARPGARRPAGAAEIARRARGTPRVAGTAAAPGARFRRRRRRCARSMRASPIAALNRLEVDERGLDAMDRRYLGCIAENYGGGPVGVETLAAALSEQRDVIEEVIEPYLIQEGLLQRTPRGRMLTDRRLSAIWDCRSRPRAAAARPADREGDACRRQRRGGRRCLSVHRFPDPRLLRGHRCRRHRLLRQLSEIRRAGAHRDAARSPAPAIASWARPSMPPSPSAAARSII